VPVRQDGLRDEPGEDRRRQVDFAYECDPDFASSQFQMAKKQYFDNTGRIQHSDVIAYQLRQSFKPGEVTPEEANQIGCELAARFTKGEHAILSVLI
jgi:hypothetical protein